MDPQASGALALINSNVPDAASVFVLGSLTSLLAGLGTSLGALGIYLLHRPSARTLNALISGAAGVMLAAAFFSLLQPGIDYAEARALAPGLGTLEVILAAVLGAGLMHSVHRNVPHEHFGLGKEGPDSAGLGRLWLFVIAITLHNFPEGLAVGVGFAGGDTANGLALGLGIGLQNVPEGLAVGVSMLALGFRRHTAFGVASLTGLVEPVAGVLGAALVGFVAPLMPLALGVAGGAMLFVVSDEIIPETHHGPYRDTATFSLLGGVALMLLMDQLFA